MVLWRRNACTSSTPHAWLPTPRRAVTRLLRFGHCVGVHATPHTASSWQESDAAEFQRLRAQYDTEAGRRACVAMHASARPIPCPVCRVVIDNDIIAKLPSQQSDWDGSASKVCPLSSRVFGSNTSGQVCADGDHAQAAGVVAATAGSTARARWGDRPLPAGRPSPRHIQAAHRTSFVHARYPPSPWAGRQSGRGGRNLT